MRRRFTPRDRHRVSRQKPTHHKPSTEHLIATFQDSASALQPFTPCVQLPLAPDQYINRELSWIAFNQRVLAQALDQRTPLLDQAKFSAIFSNNLDEFFMVRVASLKSQVEAGISTPSEDGKTPFEQLVTIREHLLPLLRQQQEHYRHHT